MDKFVFYKKLKRFDLLFKSMEKDHIGEFSAQCAYYTMLSFIPFIILLITLVQYTGIQQEALFDAISRIIPENMSELVLNIVKEVYSKSVGTISISLIFTIWSAGKGMYALTKGIQNIFHTKKEEKDNFIILKLKSFLHTIIFSVLLIVGLAILVFGKSVVAVSQEKFDLLRGYSVNTELLLHIILFFVISIIFLFLYKFIQKQKVSFKSQLVGSLFASLALNVISYVFSKYLLIFKNFTVIYGSLTTIMLVMMWTYACFYSVFLGAEINKFIGIIKSEKKKLF